MMKNTFCCPNCFDNIFISNFVNDNHEMIGDCPYCNRKTVPLISIRELGIYIRECLEKAYEGCDDGTGVMYSSEDKAYLGPDGNEATVYSIREILSEKEMIFSEDTIETPLLEDLFENLYSVREIQKGAVDQYDDVDSLQWVIKDDLYGVEQTRVFHAWENFKHIIKHYSRFFDTEEVGLRENYLERLDPYIQDYIIALPRETKLYRAREIDESVDSIDKMNPYDQMGPPPAERAKTNRMSPAGIPYLYLATDEDTAIKECRIKLGKEVIVAEYSTKEELQILDLSANKVFVPCSVFDPDYDHDDIWMNNIWKNFVREISEPVAEDKNDHSYEYTATQLIAEYYRNKGLDGICFRSSIAAGKNYVFFMGPDPDHCRFAYPFPFGSEYYFDFLPILRTFTEAFKILKVSKLGESHMVIESKMI